MMLVIVFINHLGVSKQTAIFIGADEYVSKEDMPDRVINYLRAVAAGFYKGKSLVG